MPTCSGLDLLRFVRSQQGFQNLPVVSECGLGAGIGWSEGLSLLWLQQGFQNLSVVS